MSRQSSQAPMMVTFGVEASCKPRAHEQEHHTETCCYAHRQKLSLLIGSHRFLVLCPNYRGTELVGAANGGVGTLNYTNAESGHRTRKSQLRVGARADFYWRGAAHVQIPSGKQPFWRRAYKIGEVSVFTLRFNFGIQSGLGGSAPWSPDPSHDLQGSPIRGQEEPPPSLLPYSARPGVSLHFSAAIDGGY
ncbi:hypothetical protein B0H19DRAFT_1060256 [Mycena capillaripes]|nr:hypothetical protein B0H19DRAFT_1060256 [Mycena capillaripes]